MYDNSLPQFIPIIIFQNLLQILAKGGTGHEIIIMMVINEAYDCRSKKILVTTSRQ